MKKVKVLLVLGVVLAVAGATLAYAKGKPTEARIDVPGHSSIVVTDQKSLDALATFSFEDLDSPTTQIDQMGLGIEITRYRAEEDGVSIVWDRVLYFPHVGGERGYAYYIGLADWPDDSEGQWYRVSAAGEEVLLAILEQRGISRTELGGTLVRVDNDQTVSAAEGQQPVTAGIAGVAMLTAMAGLGAGWLLGRRAGNTQ